MSEYLNKNIILEFSIVLLSVFLFMYKPLETTSLIFVLGIFLLFLQNQFAGMVLGMFSIQLLLYVGNDVFHEQTSILFYLSFLLLPTMVFFRSLFFETNIKIKLVNFDKYIIMLIIYILISLILFSTNRSYGQGKLFFLLHSLSLMYLPIIFNNKNVISYSLKAISISGIFLLVLCIFAHLNLINNTTANFGDRFSVLGMNPIYLARYLMLSIIVNIFFAVDLFKNGRKFYLSSLLILLSFAQLFFTLSSGSRGPLIGGILGFLFWAVLANKLKIKQLFIAALILIILIVAIYQIIPQTLIERLLSKNVSGQSSSTIRIIANLGAINFFLSNPIQGIGFGSYQFGGGIFSSLNYPHNIFTEILSELGLIGFLLWLLILFEVYKMFSSQKKSKYYYVLGAILIASFINANLSGHIGYNKFLWFSFGLIYANYHNLKNKIY